MGKKKKSKGQKMANELMGSAMGLVGGAATMGVGSQVLGGIGGTSAVHGQQALSNLSSFMPVGAKVTGAGVAMKGLEGMGSAYKKKRKRRKKRK